MGRKNKTNNLKAIGTAFCIAVFNKALLLLTAGHNLEGIYDLEKPNFSSVSSSPFKFKPTKTKNCEIFVLVKGEDENMHECQLLNMTRLNNYDVASLWVLLPKENIANAKCRIDTEPPQIGTLVGVYGFDGYNFKNNLLEERIYIRTGIVTDIVQGENALSNKPCIGIKTNMPLNSGCSGSPLFNLETSCVLGIASRDSTASSNNNKGEGNSLFVSIIHPLGITLPDNMKCLNLENSNLWPHIEKKCLFHLVASGAINDISECYKKIELTKLTPCKKGVYFKWQSKNPIFRKINPS